MKKYQAVARTALLVTTLLAMLIAVGLGISREVLASLQLDLQSLQILLMIYASYPLYVFLLLWPSTKSSAEFALLIPGGLLFLAFTGYSWLMVYAAEPGAVPALVMVWYGMLQTAMVAGLFILLALLRMWRYR